MDPTHRGPEEHGQDAPGGAASSGAPGGHPRRSHHRGPQLPAIGPHDRDHGGAPSPGIARTARLTSGDYLLTINPIDGSEIEQCPPGSAHRPATPERHTPEERAELRRAQATTRSTVTAGAGAIAAGTGQFELPLLEREEERDRLIRLLARGRSVRLTGPPGTGRSSLLDAVADGCDDIAPDGVVRLSGYRRTATDLLYALCAAVYRMPTHRPDRAQLLELTRDIGAVVILDDIEFGGTALDDFLDATPECAFLIAATPDVAAPSPGAYLEEVALGGLSRAACMELLGRLVRRPPTDEEAAWAADLWFESEGLPLRFVQAAALLRHRDRSAAAAADVDLVADAAPGDASTGPVQVAHEQQGAHEDRGAHGTQDASEDALADATSDEIAASIEDQDGARDAPSVPTLTEGVAPAALLAAMVSEPARETLRFALALGGECPHPAHLPALIGDPQADAAIADLLGCGLITPAGNHHRLVNGVAAQLEAAGFQENATARALTAAQHYAWWAGHPSVAARRAADEGDAILGALSALVSARDTPSTPATGRAPGASGAPSAQQGAQPAGPGTGGGQRVGQLSAAVLLARTAAPAFAAGLHWSAWERCLRHGQEAARLAGEVAEEAYFHHELGVLALCTGQLDRARAELEASISLRGVLADRRGAVAGRRALALVVDRTGISAPGGLDTLGALTAGDEPPDAPASQARDGAGASPQQGPNDTKVSTPRHVAGDTLKGTAVGLGAVASGSGAGSGAGAGSTGGTGWTRGGWRSSVRRLPLLIAARRNVAAAGAGALLVAVLGTVVTLGATSGDDGAPDRGKPQQSTSRHDDADEDRAADEPARDATGGDTRPGQTAAPGTTGAASPSASTGTSQSPSASPTSGSGTPSTGSPSTSGKPTDPKPTGRPTKPTETPTTPTDRPTSPTSSPTKPTDPPTKPTDPPTEPTDPPTTAPTTDAPPQTPTQITTGPSTQTPEATTANPTV
ncbi:ATP-binding protein [Streptomyces zagrosensis]|uniref:ATPase AAA n=1 Tax=Streptomyces zagrosensis TaxID=1042984 RepID=A0A7W9UYB6_9ACTN|nr:ATP-binding protein [Streptomyces zagrosensis]MBB5935775.1 hypothetical protein [Streptomyces zagrosensis]